MLLKQSSQIVRKMTNNIKKTLKLFRNEFGVSNVTLEDLRSVIKKQGYTIIEFNDIADDENVATLVDILGLQSFCQSSKGFTYADSKYRLVFVHEALSEAEKLMILAHEEGHIYCNHLASTPILGRDVIEEHEASEFAHYLLHHNVWQRIRQISGEHKKTITTVAAAIVLLIVGCIVFYKIHCEATYYGEYYVTLTGNKYHSRDCGYVKGKDNIERLTIEQYESGEYEPCGVCLPTGE